MSKNREEINRVRTSISGVIYNDCLPTALTTNSLKDICFNYDNYLKALHAAAGGQDTEKQKEALEAIRASINLINKQSINSGSAHSVLYPKDDSLEAIRDIGETIAIIYAIPYKANSSIDYVGYAYGATMRKLENQRLYDAYAPDEFMNTCSIAVLENGDKEIAESIMVAMANCAGAVDYLKNVETGVIEGNPQYLRNLVKSKYELLASEVTKLTGHEVETSGDIAEALYTSSCINASLTFCNKDNIEEFREDGVFKDNRASDMVIAQY